MNCRIEMFCFVFWKTNRAQGIFLHLSLYSCGWKYFENLSNSFFSDVK